jgi:antitoxin ParD1/3/4
MGMNITLGPQQQVFIQSQLGLGTYESTDDLINEAVLLLADRHKRLADLRAKIEVGTAQIRNGQVTDGELAFQQLEAKQPDWASL